MIKPIDSLWKPLKGKNICMLTPSYLPCYGGIETLVETLSKELVKNGMNIHILTRSYPKCKTEEIKDGIHITRTDLINFIDKKTCEDIDMELYDYLIKYIVDNKIDILHTHMLHIIGPPLTAIIHSGVMRTKTPIIHHQHSPLETPSHIFGVKTFNWSMIISVSKWLSNQIYNSGISPAKIKTVPNFIDTDKFNPENQSIKKKYELIKKLDIEENKKMILIPSRVLKRDGTMDERKHMDTVIKALSHLSRERDFIAVLTAAGDTYYPRETQRIKKNLREMAEIFEVDDKIRIPKNNIEQEDMPTLYALSDIVALPSSNEAFGMVYIEGMASGKPNIGAISGGAPEVIIHDRTGLLIEPESDFSLFQGLKILMENNGQRIREFGNNGRNLALRKYSASKNVNQFMDIYKKLLSHTYLK